MMIILLHFSNIVICWLFILLLLLQPGLAHEGADTGMKLFIDHLFPYLLPYLILTQWLLRLSNVSSIPQHTKWRFYSQIYFLSALGGFPTGAATISFLYKQQHITKKEAPLLLAICHAPSPLFVVGFVGVEILNSTGSSWNMLVLIHLVNIVMLIFFILRFRKVNTNLVVSNHPEVNTSPLIESIKNSLPTVLLVAATVIFFTTISFVLTETLLRFQQLPNSFMLLLYSMLEMTSGLATAQNLFAHSNWLDLITIFILSMQGLSIHLQVAVLAKEAQIPMAPYIYTRIFQTIFVPFLYWLFFT